MSTKQQKLNFLLLGHQATLPEEWVELIICVALVLLQWLVDEEGKCLL